MSESSSSSSVETKTEEKQSEFLSALPSSSSTTASQVETGSCCSCSSDASAEKKSVEKVTIFDFAKINEEEKLGSHVSFDIELIATFYRECFEEVIARDLSDGQDRWKSVAFSNLNAQNAEIAMVIVSYLALCPSVESLSIIRVNNNAHRMLGEFLQSPVSHRFKNLAMARGDFDDAQLAQFCEALYDHPNLKELNLSMCRGGELMAAALAGLMVANDRLRVVQANANYFSRDALLYLLRGLVMSPHITHFVSYLTFSQEKVERDHSMVQLVQQLIQSENSLQSFSFGPFECLDEECDALFEAIGRNTRLRELVLDFHTPMTQTRANALARAIVANHTLVKLFTGCPPMQPRPEVPIQPQQEEKRKETMCENECSRCSGSSASGDSRKEETTFVDLSALEKAVEENENLESIGHVSEKISKLLFARTQARKQKNKKTSK